MKFRAVCRVEPSNFELHLEGPSNSLCQPCFSCQAHVDGLGQVREEGVAHLEVSSVHQCHRRGVSIIRRIHWGALQVVHCTAVRGDMGIWLPAAQLLVKDEVVGAGRAPVLGIVGAHHACWLRSEGQLVLSEIGIEEIESRNVVRIVTSVRFRGVGGVVLQIGRDLLVPGSIFLLHPLHHVHGVRPTQERIFACKLGGSSEARVSGDVDVRAEARQAHRILVILMKSRGAVVGQCTLLCAQDLALEKPGGLVEGGSYAHRSNEICHAMTFSRTCCIDTGVGLDQPEPRRKANLLLAACEGGACSSKLLIWRDLTDFVIPVQARHQIIQTLLNGELCVAVWQRQRLGVHAAMPVGRGPVGRGQGG
mmetsp:Transcript_71243/g.170151  ORF Transcript_71243/g.170151 Transcript_71243/m.170151 type:complete len:364 (+) Transcript_71243:1293-2384(+)